MSSASISSRSRLVIIAVVGLFVGASAALLTERDDEAAVSSPPTVSVLTNSAPTAAPTVAPTLASTTLPPTTAVPVPTAPCPTTDHGAVIDRATQTAWLCEQGVQTVVFPITSAITLPDPGEFTVYAKDMNASSTFGGYFSRMTHFVAFTYGENTGARVAFHSVPTLDDGSFVQPLDSVGNLDRRGESSGCIRVLPEDAQMVWDWLSIGDAVWVIS